MTADDETAIRELIERSGDIVMFDVPLPPDGAAHPLPVRPARSWEG